MTKKEPRVKGSGAPRRRAGSELPHQAIRAEEMAATDIEKPIHNLQVHQNELEIKNEECRRIRMELEESRDRLANLYDFAPVGYFTLDKHGIILS